MLGLIKPYWNQTRSNKSFRCIGKYCGSAARQLALSENSCSESVTGHIETQGKEGLTEGEAGAGGGDDAGGDRPEACQGLGQGGSCSLGEGVVSVTFEIV